MSDRKLRRGTRKDYVKMAHGDINNNELSELSDNDGSSNGRGGTDQETFAGKDGKEMEFNQVSEAELEEMENRLEALRVEEERLKKDQKFRRLSEETRKIEKSVKSIRKSERKDKKSGVDMKDLREMEDVVEEADRQLEKDLGIKKKTSKRKNKTRKQQSSYDEESSSESSGRESSKDQDRKKEKGSKKKKSSSSRKKKTSKKRYVSDESSSSSSDEDSCSESSSSDSDSDDDSISSSSEKKKKKKSKKKSPKSSKKKSGKAEKLTSSVKYPQKWPHSQLGQQFVNVNKKYEDLSLAEFCAGYAAILRKCKDAKKREHRLAHFEHLMYLTTRYQWRSVLSYHAAVLLEIERGNRKWGESFQDLENTTVAGNFINNYRGGGSNNGLRQRSKPGTNTTNDGEGRVLFCRNFNKGTCSHTQDHNGSFEGETQLLRHICAVCWLGSRKKASHAETSENCPLKGQQS